MQACNCWNSLDGKVDKHNSCIIVTTKSMATPQKGLWFSRTLWWISRACFQQHSSGRCSNKCDKLSYQSEFAYCRNGGILRYCKIPSVSFPTTDLQATWTKDVLISLLLTQLDLSTFLWKRNAQIQYFYRCERMISGTQFRGTFWWIFTSIYCWVWFLKAHILFANCSNTSWYAERTAYTITPATD